MNDEILKIDTPEHRAIRVKLKPNNELFEEALDRSYSNQTVADKIKDIAAVCQGGPGTICHDVFKAAANTLQPN